MEISSLLQEKQERERFKDQILGALSLHFRFVNKDDITAKESTTAGHVYSYLASILNVSKSWQFERKVREILVAEEVIKPTVTAGMVWFKGLIAKDPTEDKEVAKRVLAKHYKDRDAYRERQRANANRRDYAKEHL